ATGFGGELAELPVPGVRAVAETQEDRARAAALALEGQPAAGVQRAVAGGRVGLSRVGLSADGVAALVGVLAGGEGEQDDAGDEVTHAREDNAGPRGSSTESARR